MATRTKPRNVGIKLYKEDDDQANEVSQEALNWSIRLNQQEAVWVALHSVRPRSIPLEVFSKVVARRADVRTAGRNTGVKLYPEDDKKIDGIISQGLAHGFRLMQQEALRVALQAVSRDIITETVVAKIAGRRSR